VVGADTGADVLRVGAVRAGGEADQVAEEDGDDLALLERARRFGLGECAVQKPQNSKPSGFSLLQLGQVATR
jgi:hypothetical protein